MDGPLRVQGVFAFIGWLVLSQFILFNVIDGVETVDVECRCSLLEPSRAIRCSGPCHGTNLSRLGKRLGADVDEIHVTGGSMDTVPAQLCFFPNLTSLNLANNAISHLSARNFSCMPQLKAITISYNDIGQLDEQAFAGLYALEYLNLDHNNLALVNPSTFLQSDLSMLRTVSLAFNKLQALDSWPLVLPALSTGHALVNLSGNFISRFENTLAVSRIPLHIFLDLDLRMNQLQKAANVDIRSLYNVSKWTDLWPLTYANFDMRQNHFDCDCDMYDLVTFARPFLAEMSNAQDVYLKGMECSSPRESRGRNLFTLPDDAFRCTVDANQCTPCNCTYVPATNTSIVRCDNQERLHHWPQYVPPAYNIQLYLSGTNISDLENPYYLRNVTVLKLNHAQLRHVDAGVLGGMPNLRELGVSNNEITTISANISLVRVSNMADGGFDITGNPLKCDCLLLDFYTFVRQNSRLFAHVDNIRCSDYTRLLDKKPGDFRCEHHPHPGALFWSLITGAILTILLVALCGYYLVKRHFKHIQLTLLSYFHVRLPRPMTSYQVTTTPPAYERDIGILCYEETDRSYAQCVGEAIHSLDLRYVVYHSFELQINQRNFEILGEMQRCKTVFVLLSIRFLEDVFSVQIFHFLIDNIMRDKHARLIPVLVEAEKELLSGCIDNIVGYYLSRFTRVKYSRDQGKLKQNLRAVISEPMNRE